MSLSPVLSIQQFSSRKSNLYFGKVWFLEIIDQFPHIFAYLRSVDQQVGGEGPLQPVIFIPEVLLGNLVFGRSHALHGGHARNWLDPIKVS